MKEIYLDNAATTRVSQAALQAATNAMVESYGNPSSLHAAGARAAKLLKEARRTLAGLLAVPEKELYFTSCGSESNNTAVFGVAASQARLGKKILIGAVEHPSLSEPAKLLAEKFLVEKIPVDSRGAVNLVALEQLLDDDVIFVGLQYVNNETGLIQPLTQVGELIKNQAPQAHFHIDGVQGFGKLPVEFKKWHADSFAASAHKLGGLKGCGLFWLREGARCRPFIYGGGQERGFRSGTENMAGICSFAAVASEACNKIEQNTALYQSLRERLWHILANKELGAVAVSNFTACSPHIANISFPGVRSEVLLHYLEANGIYASSGSACHSNKSGASPVLMAMGLDKAVIDGAIRFSFSPENTLEQMDFVAEVIFNSVVEIRSLMSRKH